MRLFLTLTLCLLATSAGAGENKYLGAVVVSGASLTNLTTAAPFAIPPGAYLTINCTAAIQYLADSTVVTTSGAGKGLPIPASTNFPTSVGKGLSYFPANSPTALIAFIGTGTCDIWQRSGLE